MTEQLTHTHKIARSSLITRLKGEKWDGGEERAQKTNTKTKTKKKKRKRKNSEVKKFCIFRSNEPNKQTKHHLKESDRPNNERISKHM